VRLDNYRSGLDRGAPAWKEALWLVVRIPLFLWPIPLPGRLRAGVLRAFGAKIGQGAVIRSCVEISFPWRFSCGDHVWIGEGVRILSLGQVNLGPHVCVSQEAFLCTGSHDYRSSGFALVVRPINVGEGSWIAARALVGPGVKVGKGAVVAAGAVVVRDVADGAVVGGNPARTIKQKTEEVVTADQQDSHRWME